MKMISISTILWIGFGYLSGSVPYGLLLTKWRIGVDIRTLGSKNIGVTNVLRTGRKGLALATLLCDSLKGFLPTLAAMKWGEADLFFLPTFVAIACVLGHVFPVWLKFKGGKGVAPTLGVLVALSPMLAVIAAALWISLAGIFRISSLSVLGACFATTGASWIWFLDLNIFMSGLSALLLWTHRENIVRLCLGKEPKL